VRLALIQIVAFQTLLACAARGVSAGQESESRPLESEVQIVHLLGVAEADYHQAHARYATFRELVSSGQLALSGVKSGENLRALTRIETQVGGEPVAGFTLYLSISADGAAYKLWLTPKAHACTPAWFADDTGTVYEGKPLGCQVAETEEPNPIAPASSSSGRRTTRDTGTPSMASTLSLPVPRNWAPPDVDQSVPAARSDISCPLTNVLAGASKNTEKLVENLQSFSATERIEHVEFGKDGKRRNSQSRVFDYVAQIEDNPSGSLRVDEYRKALLDLPPTPLADTGTAAFALIFHPRHIANFEFHCEGLTDLHGVSAWQLHFQETPDPTKSFHAIRIDGSAYPLRFKGRAWIAKETQEVVRLETDLVSPIPQIELQVEHLEITYAPVEFRNRNLQLWLPDTATLYIGYRGRRYERVHTFSRFQLFWIDTGQTVKDPTKGSTGPRTSGERLPVERPERK
jgi:hypothetical protein